MEHDYRILYIGCENFGKGGRSVIIYNLATLLPWNFKTDFLSTNKIKDISYIAKLNRRGGKIKEYIPLKSKYRILKEIHRAKNLISIIRGGKYHIVHINADDAWEAAKSMLIIRFASNAKIIVHAHASGSEKKSTFLRKVVLKLSQKYILKYADMKLACSYEAGTYMFSKLQDVYLIKNGIYIKDYLFDETKREIIRNKLFIRKSQIVIGSIGRLEKIKNHIYALHIIEQLKEKYDIKYLIIGDGSLKGEILDECKKLNIEESVILLDHQDNISDFIQAMDIFLLPSIKEGFGIVNIEAQASGIPCFVSTGVPLDAKINNNFYYLSLELSAKEWAKFIGEKIDSNKISRCKLNVVTRFKSRGFDIEKNIDILLNYYQKVMLNEHY